MDHIELTIESGQIYGLVGGRKAGKSTLLRILSTLLSPDSGSAEVNGHDVIDEPLGVRESIGVVFHESSVYDRFTLKENLRFFAGLRRIGKGEFEERAEELLHALNLVKEADSPCTGLTESQKRRLALACAVMHKPPVLLIDEPSDELDIITTRLIGQFLTNYSVEGKTVLIATRNLVDARLLCRKMALLRNGFVVAAGTLDELEQASGESGLREALPELDLEKT